MGEAARVTDDLYTAVTNANISLTDLAQSISLSLIHICALVGGGFGAAAVSVWDKINDTKADIQKVEATVQEAPLKR